MIHKIQEKIEMGEIQGVLLKAADLFLKMTCDTTCSRLTAAEILEHDFIKASKTECDEYVYDQQTRLNFKQSLITERKRVDYKIILRS
jgi:hypothetical protein